MKLECLQLTGDINAAKSTPKNAVVGGVRFHRSKNGNLYRAGVIKAQRYYSGFGTLLDVVGLTVENRRHAGVKKINEPCKIFSSTGTSSLLHIIQPLIGCAAYFGS